MPSTSKDKSKRQSVEDKLDTLASSFFEMRQMMIDSGMLNEDGSKRGMMTPSKDVRNKRGNMRQSLTQTTSSKSHTTIYENAVPLASDQDQLTAEDQPTYYEDQEVSFKVNNNQNSFSSDDSIDTSDELMDVDLVPLPIADKQSSHGREYDQFAQREEKHDSMICDAESAKANMVPKGMSPQLINDTNTMSVAQVDENYLLIGAHINQGLRNKIVNFEYIDFSRLLPRDRVTREDDHRMELVSRGGSTFFVSVVDREMTSINSFTKWEQAFSIYMNVITSAYLNKSAELVQYNHVIFTASQMYV